MFDRFKKNNGEIVEPKNKGEKEVRLPNGKGL